MPEKKNNLKKTRNNQVAFIRKSNDLVEARYKFDIWEMRIFTKMITMIEPDDWDFKDYKLYLKEIIRDFALPTDGRTYLLLKEGADRLISKVIKVIVKDADGWMELKTPIIGGVKNPIDEGKDGDNIYIKVSFHPDLKPFLLELKSKYLVYDARNILSLPSTYSIRIYELLKQYEKIGQRTMEVQELKEMLGVTSEYPLYANFKQRVVDKAQKDLLTNTDISFTYVEIKSGKSVVALTFFISKNQPKNNYASRKERQSIAPAADLDIRPSETDDRQHNALFDELYPRISHWGITAKTLLQLIESYEPDAVWQAIRLTEKAEQLGRIKLNAGGFFVQALKEHYVDLDEADAARKAQRRARDAQRRQDKEQLDLAIRNLQTELYAKEKNIIETYLSEHQEERVHVLRQAKMRGRLSYEEGLSEEENLRKPSFFAVVYRVVKELHPALFTGVGEEYMQKIARLKKTISN